MDSIIKVKKIYATISEDLYNKLAEHNILGFDFDNWIADAIFQKLKKLEEEK